MFASAFIRVIIHTLGNPIIIVRGRETPEYTCNEHGVFLIEDWTHQIECIYNSIHSLLEKVEKS